MPADILVKKSEGVYVINKKQFYPMGVINFSQTSRKRQRPCATRCKSAAATAHNMLSRRKRPRAARTHGHTHGHAQRARLRPSARVRVRVFLQLAAPRCAATRTRCTHAARTLRGRTHAHTHTHTHARERTHTRTRARVLFLPSAILTLATAAQLVCYSTRAARRCASPFNPHTHKTLMNPHKLALFSFLFTLLLIIGTVYAAVIMATI